MVSCSQCSASNTLDSSFCRRCGTALPADAVTKGRDELEVLVGEGTRAFEEGRIDDAASIAEEAVLTDPASANAHALKGMVHERRGEVARALECYERVVDLNPSSALDRIKLANLRQALADRATAAAPDRRVPMLAGLSAAALIVCAGIGFAKLSGNASVATTSPNTTNKPATSLATGVPDAGPVASNANPGVKPVATNLDPTDVQPIRGSSDLATTAPTGNAGGGSERARLPRPRASQELGEVELSPAPIGGNVPSGAGNSNGSLPPAGNNSGYIPSAPSPRKPVDPDPIPQTGPTTTTPAGPTGSPKKGDGVIQIETTRGGTGRPTKGSDGESSGKETLRRVGDASFQSGDNARAANSYERARRTGNDDPSLNQRLGQAYERMGRKSEAAAAYNRAQAGYEARVKANPNDDRAKNALSSVQQAQKVLNRG